MSIEYLKTYNFYTHRVDIYYRKNEFFITIDQLANCLEYAKGIKGIEDILKRNDYLKSNKLSQIKEINFLENGVKVRNHKRLFTEIGVYEVSVISNKTKAREFRGWFRSVIRNLRKTRYYMDNDSINSPPNCYIKNVDDVIVNSEIELTNDKSVLILLKDIKHDLEVIKKCLKV